MILLINNTNYQKSQGVNFVNSKVVTKLTLLKISIRRLPISTKRLLKLSPFTLSPYIPRFCVYIETLQKISSRRLKISSRRLKISSRRLKISSRRLQKKPQITEETTKVNTSQIKKTNINQSGVNKNHSIKQFLNQLINKRFLCAVFVSSSVIARVCVVMCNTVSSVRVNAGRSVNTTEQLTKHPQFLHFFFLPEGTDSIFSLYGSDTLPNTGVFEQVRPLKYIEFHYIESILFKLIYNDVKRSYVERNIVGG